MTSYKLINSCFDDLSFCSLVNSKYFIISLYYGTTGMVDQNATTNERT